MTKRSQRQSPTAEPIEALDHDQRWLAVQRVVQSKKFTQAARLSSFLLYVSRKALEGKPEEATEQQVGIHVFARQPGYNPADDNIVRSTARQLRERLALYYQEEGQQDAIKIQLARGSYVPSFCEERETAVPSPPVSSKYWFWAWPIALLAIAALGWVLLRPQPDPLWALLLDSPRALLLVPGDSGTVLRQNLSGEAIHVAEYAASQFAAPSSRLADAALIDDVGSRRYTSFSDLKFTARLAMLPHLHRERFSIRFARDLHVDDLKGANLILVGSPQGNPWVELFQKDLNFQIVSDEPARKLTVRNRQPLPGEAQDFTYSANDPSRRAYALLALTRNLDNTGYALLVQGTTVAGIEAATDFLFHEASMRPILDEAQRGAKGLRGFEVLLETGNIAASGVGTTIRAKRFRSF